MVAYFIVKINRELYCRQCEKQFFDYESNAIENKQFCHRLCEAKFFGIAKDEKY